MKSLEQIRHDNSEAPKIAIVPIARRAKAFRFVTQYDEDSAPREWAPPTHHRMTLTVDVEVPSGFRHDDYRGAVEQCLRDVGCNVNSSIFTRV